MPVADLLDDLVAGCPGCRMAAYADLDAAMVLLARGPDVPPREGLDALCAMAALHLPPGEGDAAAAVRDAGGLTVFLRGAAAPGEALVLLAGSGADPVGLLAGGRSCLSRLLSGGPA
ncbi:MAG: hypothetical protein ACU0BS_02900 [Hasllibacter sp.]